MAGEIKKNNKHLINAPAGSGKTTYIREQLKSICLNKPKSKILCITYTNRATDELKKDLDSDNITISTIHSYINDLISPFYSHKEALDLYWEIYGTKINERIINGTDDVHIAESNQNYIEKYGELNEDIVRKNLGAFSAIAASMRCANSSGVMAPIPRLTISLFITSTVAESMRTSQLYP